jgi:site-specific DNA-methyltransferase (adenine-specific)
MKQIKLMQGDNILSLKKLPENSIDSIVTDPPYGLSAAKNSGKTSTGGFMGKLWDYEVPSIEFWQEAFRVLKPGGHVLSFGGTRTYHRMVVNMEDAGFEIRDQIMWIYGSGFPKSHNIGKSYDKKVGNEREVVGHQQRGESVNTDFMSGGNDVTKGSSQYEGWGTALKPANEPICLARKPLSEKTIVDNVIKWGTGGINVDGCRIEIDGVDDRSAGIRTANFGSMDYQSGGNGTEPYEPNEGGRFPANILFDEETAQVLDEQSGDRKGMSGGGQGNGWFNKHKEQDNKEKQFYNDKGGASRFFYVAKVGKKERNLGLDNFEDKETTITNQSKKCNICNKWELAASGEEYICKCETPDWNTPIQKNNHPTLKPINLMTYLCRLITPPGGIVLDPFMGSGSTGISACLEGFRFVGMELDEDYFKIAEARVNNFEEYRKLLKK